MAHFVKHEPCPKCNSRDNLGRYSDGGAWCFGCGYLEQASKPDRSQVSKEYQPPPTDLTTKLPEKSVVFLQQYLDSKQIAENFRYSPSMDRHVFMVKNGDKYFWEARSLDKKPKTLSHNDKPLHIMGPWNSTGIIIAVEDIVSAIKVSRFYGSWCLFGCYAKPEYITKVAKLQGVDTIIWWLDHDKWAISRHLCRMTSLLGYKTATIHTDKDPKEFQDPDLVEEVETVKAFL